MSNRARSLCRLTAVFVTLLCASASAQRASAPRAPDLVLTNDKLELSISQRGGAFTKLTIKGGDGLSPLHTIGHFVALDGFGAPSEEERAAGMPFHGEARRAESEVTAQSTDGPVHSITQKAMYPLAEETLMRTVTMVDGESVVYVSSELESGIGVDRPVSWAEHATIGGAFLEPGKTVVDMPATKCRVRPFKPGPIPGHLVYGADFTWPMAPTEEGPKADLRVVPTDHNWLDLASCLMDPTRETAYVTALHLDKNVLFGYLFRRADYPWLMSWMNYTGQPNAARGMEFSSQPFDVSHRETVAMSPMFGQQTFRWLPAKAKLENRFLFFYTNVPAGVTRIDDVTLERGNVVIKNNTGQDITLEASRGLAQ